MQWQRFDFDLPERRQPRGLQPSLLRGVFGAKLHVGETGSLGADPRATYRTLFERPGPAPYRCVVDHTPNETLRASLILLGNASAQISHDAQSAFRSALRELGFPEPITRSTRTQTFADLCRSPAAGAASVEIELRSPLRIKRHGRVLSDTQQLDFGLFSRYLLQRLDALAQQQGDRPIEQLSELLLRARAVETLSQDLRFHSGARYSARQRRRIPLDGWTGVICFAHVPAPFLPFLQCGTDLGLGSGCAYGLGNYRVRQLLPTPSADTGIPSPQLNV